MSLTITGIKALDDKLKAMEPKLAKKLIKKATNVAAKAVLRDAKRLVPRDSGKLMRSLTVRTATKKNSPTLGKRGATKRIFGHVVTTRDGWFQGDEFYGGFVEWGTAKWKGSPFLRRALYGNAAAIRTIFKGAVASLLRDMGK